MSKSYDLRVRSVSYVRSGGSKAEAALKQAIEARDDARLIELADHFGVHPSTISKALKRRYKFPQTAHVVSDRNATFHKSKKQKS